MSETVAEQELMQVVLEQAQAFEDGLSEVVSGAINAGLHPMAIATGAMRVVARISAAVVMAQGISADEWQEVVAGLANAVTSDMRSNHAEKFEGAFE